MNDVARVAMVSLKTVSRFVNGQTNIDPELSGRIAEAITVLGYRRNLAAASIRPGRTSKVLGLIIGDMANPFYSVLARAIETRAHESGYLLITASSDEDGFRHDELVDRLLEQQVDGLLIVPPWHPGRSWDLMPARIPPVVFIDRPAEYGTPGPISADTVLTDTVLTDTVLTDTVLTDNLGGAQAATAALLENGARRPAFVGDSLGIYTMRERHKGYLAALAAAGIEAQNSWLVTDAHGSSDAAATVKRMLVESDVDSIFAANNRASIGALMAFREIGRRLPIVGFDDFEAAVLGEPGVSVVSQDIPEMGRRAAELLIDRLNGGKADPSIQTLPARLVLRGSERA
jgi:LacI family transcriptional regulator